MVQVPHTDDGMEAIIFTAQGDMRQVGGGIVGCYRIYCGVYPGDGLFCTVRV